MQQRAESKRSSSKQGNINSQQQHLFKKQKNTLTSSSNETEDVYQIIDNSNIINTVSQRSGDQQTTCQDLHQFELNNSEEEETKLQHFQMLAPGHHSHHGHQNNVQFKSLGSIEEESPRWTHPPKPQQNNSHIMQQQPVNGVQHQQQPYPHNFRGGINMAPDSSEVGSQPSDRYMSGRDFARGNSNHNSNLQDQSKNQNLQGYERHVQSQPTLAKNASKIKMDSNREQNQRIDSEQHGSMPPHYGNQLTQLAGIGSLLSGQDLLRLGDDSHRQVGFSSPAYRIPDSQLQMMLFSGRTSQKPHSSLFQNFIDRLYTREKVSEIADELKSLQTMLFNFMSKEVSATDFKELSGLHNSQQTSSKSNSTHVSMMQSTLDLAQALNKSFSKFQIRRNEVQSFNQLVDGIQMENQDSAGSLPEHQRDHHESTINQIKMGTMPSNQYNTSGSIGKNQESQQDFMVQIMRQQEHEIARCNTLIDSLKTEAADLELTIVDQRSEIQNLCNKLKQSHIRQNSETNKEKIYLEKREMENVVNRLKDEIRASQDESRLSKGKLNESNEIIQNLHGQIISLKHKLVISDDASRNFHGSEFQNQLQEVADLRQKNTQINERYQQMAQSFNDKEFEIQELEEKSKQMLIAAQKDAHSCIKYFKSLAYQQNTASKERAHSEKNRSLSPQNNVTIQSQFQNHRSGRTSFPRSLAPVLAPQRKSNQNFKQEGKEEFSINGVKLRMNNIRTSSKTSSQKNQQRAQTLSPMPMSRMNHKDEQADLNKKRGKFATLDIKGEKGQDQKSPRKQDPIIQSSTVRQAEIKLECTINALVETFAEINLMKQGITDYVQNYGEQYCLQLQKFSVLAYDYLERIDNHTKREALIEEELIKSASMVDQLKRVTINQTEHISAQNSLILQQKNQIALQGVTNERVGGKYITDFAKVGKLIQVEFPLLRDTIIASHVALLEQKKYSRQDQNDISEGKNLHDLSKKKVKILEEELEKSLQTSQLLEETIQADRKKLNQLVDLIKDIWQEEVYNTAVKPASFIGTSRTQNVTSQGNHGSTSQVAVGSGGVIQMLQPNDMQSDLGQTINSTNNVVIKTTTDVPMPISWLSDISEHIKTLKEMNDFQTDEVFQIVNMLHDGGSQRNLKSDKKAAIWTRNCDSNSTEEDDKEGRSLQESGISQTYQHADTHTMRDEDPTTYTMEEQKEETDTERSLEHYNEERNRLVIDPSNFTNGVGEKDIGDADDLYVQTTSECVSKSKSKVKAPKEDFVGQFDNLMQQQSQDKKEMSFSQKLEDDEDQYVSRVGRHAAGSQKIGRVQSHTGRQTTQQWIQAAGNTSDSAAGVKRDRSNPPPRNLDWSYGNLLVGDQRAVETQRAGNHEQQRRSLNVTSSKRNNGWKEVIFSANAGKNGPPLPSMRRSDNNFTHNNSSFGGMINQPSLQASAVAKNYRASIDFTATAGTIFGGAPDVCNNKRNELYSMLREEVLGHLKQKEVSKDTIMGMKRQKKDHQREIQSAHRDYQILCEEKESILETNKHLQGEIKDLELQIDDLQSIVQDRENSMNHLKMQIEDFEKELLGLQDQMTHVMKLNQEIGMASEHWERSYHQLQEDQERDRLRQREDFQQQMNEKIEKISQFKRKLQEKENSLKNLQSNLASAETERQKILDVRHSMISVEIQTEPALELLEQHKIALESKLGQVKQDVGAVLDQVEKEQVENHLISEKLQEQKDTNKSLLSELNQTTNELIGARKEVQNTQDKLTSSLEEIARMQDAMFQDQDLFRSQIEEADRINQELQQQVQEVTNTANELQDQISGNYQSNEGLIHNAEIQEQKINQLEDQLLYYQRQLQQKNRTIAGLEQKANNGTDKKRQRQRETRSVSIPRITNKNNASTTEANQETQADYNDKNNYSQMHDQYVNPMRHNSSISKNSSFLYAAGPSQIETGKGYICNQDDAHNQTIQTSQSIFDDVTPLVTEENTVFNNMNNRTSISQNHFQSTSQAKQQVKKKPPRNLRTGSSAHKKTPKTAMSNTEVSTSIHYHRNQRGAVERGSFQQDTTDELDISPLNPLGKTQAGISTIMGASQHNSSCCCGTTQCLNTSQQMLQMARKQSDFTKQDQSSKNAQRCGKMTAIDDLQSSYNQFKVKQETVKEVKRKTKKILYMMETLARFYLNEAQLKTGQSREAYLKQVRQSHNSSTYTTGTKVDNDQALDARSYFKKRCPNVISCLESLVQQVDISKAYQSNMTSEPTNTASDHPHEQVIKSIQKEPPQIVSHRQKEDLDNDHQQRNDTDISELIDAAAGGISARKLSNVNIMGATGQGGQGYHTLNQLTGDKEQTLNLIIQEEYSDLQNVRGRNQPVTTTNQQTVQNILGTGWNSLKSPASSCRNCTATFHQTQSVVTQDLVGHCKVLFQKFLQTGRSLAGICYGGYIFMGDSIDQKQRQKVDYALSFLAKDSSEFEGTNGQSMDELWGVVDGLLTCLSQIISGSCQQSLKAKNLPLDQKQQQQAFDSIAQKSIELSMDQNHMVSRLEKGFLDGELSNTKSVDYLTSQNVNMSIATSQVGPKLQELETRIKQKFSNIKSLETLLDTILGKKKGRPTMIPQLVNDIGALQKVFLNVRRVVSKLKIELHQDYLHIGQVNLNFQTSKDHHNSSMGTTTTFELLPNIVTNPQTSQQSINVQQQQMQQHQMPLQLQHQTTTLQPQTSYLPGHLIKEMQGGASDNTGATLALSNNPQQQHQYYNNNNNQIMMQQVYNGQQPQQQTNNSTLITNQMTPRDNNNIVYGAQQQQQQQQQQQMFNNTATSPILQHKQPQSAAGMVANRLQMRMNQQTSQQQQQQEYSDNKKSSTSMPGFPTGAPMSSARCSSNSMATNTARNPTQSAGNIDQILEELQGLTFEYSNVDNLQTPSMSSHKII